MSKNTGDCLKKFKKAWKKWLNKEDSPYSSSNIFILIFFLKYALPPTLILILFLQVGLVSPELDVNHMNSTFEAAGDKIANAYVSVISRMFIAGQNISQVNPTVGIILKYGISAFVYSLWGILTSLMVYIIMRLIKMAFRRKKKRRKK